MKWSQLFFSRFFIRIWNLVMKVKGKQIKDIAVGIECHILILFQVSCRTQWKAKKKSWLSSWKYAPPHLTSSQLPSELRVNTVWTKRVFIYSICTKRSTLARGPLGLRHYSGQTLKHYRKKIRVLQVYVCWVRGVGEECSENAALRQNNNPRQHAVRQ